MCGVCVDVVDMFELVDFGSWWCVCGCFVCRGGFHLCVRRRRVMCLREGLLVEWCECVCVFFVVCGVAGEHTKVQL